MNEPVGSELSAAARQVISASRAGDDPTAEDEARVKARWLAGIAAGAGVSSLSEAVRAAATTGWGLKVGALAAALAAATAGMYLGWAHLSESNGASAPAPSSSAPSSSAAAPVPVVRTQAAAPVSEQAAGNVVAPAPQAVPPEPPSEVAAPAAAPAVAHPAVAHPAVAHPVIAARPRAVPRRTPAAPSVAVPAAAAASGQLGEEISMLSEIRGQLQAGAASRALEQLAEYRRHFGQPNLAMEADALRVDALCQAGQRDAARAAIAAFATNWPASPLQQRVSAACP